MPPLNLVLHRRRPSVWVQMEERLGANPRALTMIAAGAVLTASAQRRGLVGRTWGTVFGVACMATGLFYDRLPPLLRSIEDLFRHPQTRADQAIDDAVDDSFPASDPPSSMRTA